MDITCAVTGESSTGKHYVLKTTEGEELVSPHALLNPVKFLMEAARDLGRFRAQIEQLEERIDALTGDKEPDLGPAEDDQAHEETDQIREAATKAAAPVKKAPGQRKASD